MSEAEKKSEVESLTDNQYIKQLLNSKIFKYFSKDTSSKITLATAVVTLGSFLIRALDYMRLKGYLSVFSVPIEYVNYSANQGFSGFVFQAIIFIGYMLATCLSYLGIELMWSQHDLRKARYEIEKTKFLARIHCWLVDAKKAIPVLLCIVLIKSFINALIWMFSSSAKIINSFGIPDWMLIVLFFSVVEFIVASIMFFRNKRKNRKAKENEMKEDVRKQQQEMERVIRNQRPPLFDIATSSIVILVFLLSTMMYFCGVWTAHATNEFLIVEEKYAVVYQTGDYYWTVATTEEDNVLTIDTTHQKVIAVEDVETERREFVDVIIGYESVSAI